MEFVNYHQNTWANNCLLDLSLFGNGALGLYVDSSTFGPDSVSLDSFKNYIQKVMWIRFPLTHQTCLSDLKVWTCSFERWAELVWFGLVSFGFVIRWLENVPFSLSSTALANQPTYISNQMMAWEFGIKWLLQILHEGV